MTRFLASVATPDEAIEAVDGGADVIDCKDPATGALGALPPATVAAIVAAVAGRVPVSATVGDLPMDPVRLASVVSRTAACGVDFVKVGLFPLAQAARCVRAIGDTGVASVAVFFADRDPYPALGEFDLLAELGAAGFAGAMLDTAYKNGTGLRGCLAPVALARFVGDAHAAGLFAGLAGALQTADIAPLLRYAPDLLGFRTALCGVAGRRGALVAEAVAAVRARISAADAAWPGRTVPENRLRLAGGALRRRADTNLEGTS